MDIIARVSDARMLAAAIRMDDTNYKNVDDRELHAGETLTALANDVERRLWQPIETAPKDGTPVDLWCRAPGLSSGQGRVTECWYSSEKWWRHDSTEHADDQCRSRVHNATHWMPIPAPPNR